MSELVVEIKGLKKEYKLGTIGGKTLNAELQSWIAKRRGKEDPNSKIGDNKGIRYGESFLALDGIDLEIYKGDTLGIIGPNGAGKSTLLKILSRVTAPSSGDVWIKGRIASLLEVGTGFHNELTGRENIYMNGAILGMSKKEVDKKMDSIIEFSECAKFIDTPVKRYSSGMKVKLAFAVASHLDAEILIMDEVLAVGDLKFQKKCLKKMSEEARSGKTILYVSHNMDTVRSLCNRCIVLNKGKIVYNGNVEKAIAYYMEQSGDSLPTEYDVSKTKRPNKYLGKMAWINKISFIGKKTAKYNSKEIISMKVNWDAIENISNARIRVAIRYIGSINIGQTETDVICNAFAGNNYEHTITFNPSSLCEGIYYFTFFICIIDEYGKTQDLDAVPDDIYFEINNDGYSNRQWKQNEWGNIVFDTMKVIN